MSETVSKGSSGRGLVQSDQDRELRFWEAIQSRNPSYFSTFVYAAHSTKIYCRPTCASQKPRRLDRVTFFDSARLAEEAGYRPCFRCNPDDASSSPANVQAVQKVCEFITENSQEKLTLERLSHVSKLSPFYLQRTFKKVTGVTPREYVEAVRLSHLRLALKSGHSIRESTYGAGYSTAAWLYLGRNARLGMRPSRYKKGGEDLVINYLITDSPLGKLLVAATEKGICFVSLADSSQKLLTYLRSEYPKATIESEPGKNKNLTLSVQEITEYLSKGTDLAKSSLPLDFRATAFQQKVWKELQRIPYGKVASYSEVAKRIGLPRATRAVASAVASNPVPLIVPCHRVVPKGGGVGEYGLGPERKRKLLEKEGVDTEKL